METIWTCRIGILQEMDPPSATDGPMRKAVAEAFLKLTGAEPDFIFSGWDAKLSPAELAFVNAKRSIPKEE